MQFHVLMTSVFSVNYATNHDPLPMLSPFNSNFMWSWDGCWLSPWFLGFRNCARTGCCTKPGNEAKGVGDCSCGGNCSDGDWDLGSTRHENSTCRSTSSTRGNTWDCGGHVCDVLWRWNIKLPSSRLYNMKTFSLCILAAVFVCLRAAPAWYDLLPATNLKKGGFGAIWNDCSKAAPLFVCKLAIFCILRAGWNIKAKDCNKHCGANLARP